MSPKCVETIYHPSLEDEEIVHPLEKSWDKVHHKSHNRNRYGFRHHTESASSNRGSQHPNRCGDEHRQRRQIAVNDPAKRGEASRDINYSLVSLFIVCGG